VKERILDTLTALSSTDVTSDLIKELKLGKAVSSLKEKFDTISTSQESSSDSTTTAKAFSLQCKDILLKWKRIVEASSSITKLEKKEPPAPVASVSICQQSPTATQTQITESSGVKSFTALNIVDISSSMSVARRQVLGIISKSLKGPTRKASVNTDSIAIDVEEAIHSQFLSNEKDYLAKAKSLTFNLKKNEVCVNYLPSILLDFLYVILI